MTTSNKRLMVQNIVCVGRSKKAVVNPHMSKAWKLGVRDPQRYSKVQYGCKRPAEIFGSSVWV